MLIPDPAQIADIAGGPPVPRRPGPADHGDLPRGAQGAQYQTASGQSMTVSERWPIQGLRIDNYTNQWLLVRAGVLTHAVPPYRAAVRLNVWGLSTLSVDSVPAPWVAGAGYTQPAVIAGELYTVTTYNRRWAVEDKGEPLPPSTAATNATGTNSATVTPIRPLLIRSILVIYTTSAALGSRQVQFRIGPVGAYWQVDAGITQAPSTTVRYNISGAVARETALIGADDVLLPLPDNLVTGVGVLINVRDAANIDAAGDTITMNVSGDYLMGGHA
ncbi:MAG: hypothetical protein KGK07_13540 [Chloroflexota bacterium]|nr:hypothetical protein [Chloroflexota bacterium]